MKEIKINSFSPQGGPVGTDIRIILDPASAPKEPPGSLHTFGGLFSPATPGGSAIGAPGVEILDHETYTRFSIRVPHGIMESEFYSFSMTLFPTAQAETRESYLLDSGGEDFYVMPPPTLPTITSISPTSLHQQNLLSTIFHVQGHNLNKLSKQQSPVILSPSPIRLSYIILEKDTATLKVAAPPDSYHPGSYSLRFIDLNNKYVYSNTKLKLS